MEHTDTANPAGGGDVAQPARGELRLSESLTHDFPDVLEWTAFESEIRKERMRSDRSGQPFEVAFFCVKQSTGPVVMWGVLEILIQSIRETCRDSDTKGLFQEGKRLGIAVILHGAPPNVAGRAINGVLKGYRTIAQTWRDKGLAMPAVEVDTEDYPLTEAEAAAAEGEGPSQPAEAPEPPPPPLMRYGLVSPLPFWKRSLDVVGAGLGLMFLSPLFLAVAAVIKVSSPGPIFFKQERVGHLGKRFVVWKFRTMRNDSDASGHQQHLTELIQHDEEAEGVAVPKAMTKLERDPRIFPFGRFLRVSCIDELPQLLNVLLGQMSLVGPRPPIPYEVAEYQRWHVARFEAVPGMTGLWQVSGKNRLTFKQMVRLDICYARNRSFWLDLKIIFVTPLAVIRQVFDQRQEEEEHREP